MPSRKLRAVDDEVAVPVDRAGDLLARALHSGVSDPAGALDRLAAVHGLRRLLDDQEQEAVIGARLARCTWTEMGEAVGISRQGAFNRWGGQMKRSRVAGVVTPDHAFGGS